MSSKTLEIIAEALVDGDVSLVKSSVQKAVEEGIIAKEILNEGLLAGMDEVGDLFSLDTHRQHGVRLYVGAFNRDGFALR